MPADLDVPCLRDIIGVLDDLYDPALAEDWDAVGTVTGDYDQPVRRILFAVDPADEVVTEAIQRSADLIVCHHPLLLRGVHTVAADTAKGRVVHALIRNGIALHVAHTNADSANPGVSDALAAAVGVGATRPLLSRNPTSGLDKLVAYVPQDRSEQLIDALAAAGAGAIGAYDRCAWSTPGTGTFRPLTGANPAIGAVGKIEKVAEDRVEIVLPRERRPAVLAALRAAHPYEEPAFDLYELAAAPGPDAGLGLGRVGELSQPIGLGDFAARVAAALPATAQGVRVAGDLDRQLATVAVCGGAGDAVLDQARALGADAYLTADLRHHPATEALARSDAPALIDVAHWASEWPWLPDADRLLRASLADRGASVETHISTLVTDAWTAHRCSAAAAAAADDEGVPS